MISFDITLVSENLTLDFITTSVRLKFTVTTSYSYYSFLEKILYNYVTEYHKLYWLQDMDLGHEDSFSSLPQNSAGQSVHFDSLLFLSLLMTPYASSKTWMDFEPILIQTSLARPLTNVQISAPSFSSNMCGSIPRITRSMCNTIVVMADLSAPHRSLFFLGLDAAILHSEDFASGLLRFENGLTSTTVLFWLSSQNI